MLFQVRNAREESKGLSTISRPKGVLLVRNQRIKQDDEGHRGPSNQSMRRNANDVEQKIESRRAATRGTLICIFVCGSLLLSLGIVSLVAGILSFSETHDMTPWLVVGPTCIILGILVLLLSVEIIIKLRKISAESGMDDSDDSPEPEAKSIKKRRAGADSDIDIEHGKRAVPKAKTSTSQPAKGL